MTHLKETGASRGELDLEMKERKQVEETLRECEASLRTMINSSIGDYMAFWNVLGDFRYAGFMPSNELAAKAKAASVPGESQEQAVG